MNKISGHNARDIWEAWKNVSLQDKFDILCSEKIVESDAKIWGYKLIFSRNPENIDRIINLRKDQAISDLSKEMFLCEEFKKKYKKYLDYEELQKLDKEIQSNKIAYKNTNEITIWQSCDKEKYWPMLKETQKTVQEYSRRHLVNYEFYVGLKKGCYPIHAAYNRIYKLNELLDSGYEGWFIYMDTDAFIQDFEFSFEGYLMDKSDYAMIATPILEDVPYWNINNGFFIFNLSHPIAKTIIREWKSFYDNKYTDEDYNKAETWDVILNDQTSLHDIIKIPLFEKYIYTNGTRELFNTGHARVIRQIIRPNNKSNCFDSLEGRINRIASEVNKILVRLGEH